MLNYQSVDPKEITPETQDLYLVIAQHSPITLKNICLIRICGWLDRDQHRVPCTILNGFKSIHTDYDLDVVHGEIKDWNEQTLNRINRLMEIRNKII